MMTKKSPKIANDFSCIKCTYICRKETDFKKHLLTLKHKKNDIELHENLQKEYACNCGKVYSFRQGLSAHKKKCKLESGSLETGSLETELKNLTSMVIDLMKSNSVLQQQLIEVCKIIK